MAAASPPTPPPMTIARFTPTKVNDPLRGVKVIVCSVCGGRSRPALEALHAGGAADIGERRLVEKEAVLDHARECIERAVELLQIELGSQATIGQEAPRVGDHQRAGALAPLPGKAESRQ